jgi:threonine dehydrogenase-like Zn-dependent dehydrogenase
MKALVLQPHTTDLALTEWPEPKIERPDEMKTQVLQVGICGTDREEASGGRADAPPGEKELVIGHEMISRVVEVGKSVRSFKVGDFAVITVRRGCNACSACKVGRSDMCETGRYTERGIKGAHGFQCEYVVDQEAFGVKVDPSIATLGVLAEPMSVVQKALEEASLIQSQRLPYLKNSANWLEGKTALIAGLGPIGLLAAIVLRLRGANILGLDIVDPKSPRAQIFSAIGGTYMTKKPTGEPVDLILDAAGIAKLDFDLTSILAVNGIFVLTGVPGDQRLIDIDGAHLMRQMVLKNQVMVGSVNESIHHFEKGLQDIALAAKKWPGVVEKLITKKVPYTAFKEVMSHHTPDEIKVVIDWAK